jgi:hypothetical protein
MEKKTGITFTPWETDEGTVLLLFLYIFDVFVYTLQKLSKIIGYHHIYDPK